MNIYNLKTAVQDPNLYGESFIQPLRLTVKGYKNTFSSWPANLTIDRKIAEIFKRVALAATSFLSIPITAPLAVLGVAIKWIYLSARIDQLAHKGSALGSHLPLILEIYSRLGDRTVAYLNTKYLAEELGLPVHFTPFKGCDYFQFSKEEKDVGPRYYKKVVHLRNADQIESLKKNMDKTNSTLYLLPFFPHTRDLDKESQSCNYINYNIQWEKFRPTVKKLLEVVKPHDKLDIPKDAYTIALHIRDGGDFDDGNTKTLHPLKLPCIDFYTGELNQVLNSKEIPENQPVYIHIFTDACEPKKVYEQIETSISKYQGTRQITLSYTPKEKVSLANDIANMSRFQCMIRADSNLSGPIIEGSETTQLDIYPIGFNAAEDFKTISITKVQWVKRGEKGATDEARDYPTNYLKERTGWLPRLFVDKFYDYYGVYKTPFPSGKELQSPRVC